MTPSVRRLSPELLGDWLAFFDQEAFADNPDWCGCYCHFYHADHSQRDWEARAPEENRAASVELIRAGRLQGYLAYVDGRAVGWCHAAPRDLIPNVAGDPRLVGSCADDAGVGAIVCFIVAPGSRRQGVARALLDAACAGLRDQGLTMVEAYPAPAAVEDAANYHGPLSLYMKAGFTVHRALYDGRLVVRRDLREADRMEP